MPKPAPDFIAHFGAWSTIWRIEAVSPAAKEFARSHFEVEDLMGEPEDFYADHRPANHICERLSSEGFIVGRGHLH